MPKKYALISVYDKDGIVDFAQNLIDLGFDLIASGGTHKFLTGAGLKALNCSDLVGKPILGHKVVTLSRELHAGLLGDLVEELDEMEREGILAIHLVCVDTYPLNEAINKPGATKSSVKESTDIGGPAMLRSGAKGDGRIVICDKADRDRVVDWLRNGSPDEESFIDHLAAKAEGYVARYALDSARFQSNGEITGVIGTRAAVCKYGENQWQQPAALYTTNSDDSLAIDQFKLVATSASGYNSYCDLDKLLQTATHVAAGFDKNETAYESQPFIVLAAKHGNCCGAAFSDEKLSAVRKAVVGDTKAIYGGVVLLTFEVDEEIAKELLTYETGDEKRRLLNGVVAPAFTDGAISMLKGKKGKNGKCLLLENPALSSLDINSLDQEPRIRYVRGGFLVQPNYTFVLDLDDPQFEIHSRSSHTLKKEDIIFAWAIGSTSNSNTITLVKDGQLIGNGVGQQDRVGCCELAVKRARDAGHETEGAVAYSDSFFPFDDGPLELHKAGIVNILATSGSIRDGAVKEACQSSNITLVCLPDSVGRGFYAH